MSEKTMWIAFPRGGKIPASVTGGAERACSAHEPVEVPASYGRHLIDDRFAYAAEEPKRRGQKNAKAVADPAQQLSKKVDGLRKAVDAAEGEKKAELQLKLGAAEQELAAATAN